MEIGLIPVETRTHLTRRGTLVCGGSFLLTSCSTSSGRSVGGSNSDVGAGPLYNAQSVGGNRTAIGLLFGRVVGAVAYLRRTISAPDWLVGSFSASARNPSYRNLRSTSGDYVEHKAVESSSQNMALQQTVLEDISEDLRTTLRIIQEMNRQLAVLDRAQQSTELSIRDTQLLFAAARAEIDLVRYEVSRNSLNGRCYSTTERVLNTPELDPRDRIREAIPEIVQRSNEADELARELEIKAMSGS